ncbi:biopolymer transporter ExbD [Ulvibacterium sp.]|uniref:ExbD/TolR family protein n=1 Tax=Ulvibacterium sp. TaxID=2665914 RepID=UPI002628177A|nr:biopolymer transporter ExbD [Ulvibacterium sp.]
MSKREEMPKVNAGSMADIAFLLLIFFLVTTSIETDSGIDRIMPPLTDSSDAKIKERNILRIEVNDRDELFVEEKLVQIEDLKEIAVGFLDNGGATLGTEDFCDYCRGHRDLTSSDNPSKAVISLTCQRETGYGAYITIQNELVAAYNELRNRESQRLFKEDYSKMVEHYESPGTPLLAKERLKERIQRIQKLFPQKIAEVKIE